MNSRDLTHNKLAAKLFYLRNFIAKAQKLKEAKNAKFRRWAEKTPNVVNTMSLFSQQFLQILNNNNLFFVVMLHPNLTIPMIEEFLKKNPVIFTWLNENIFIVENLNEAWLTFSQYSRISKLKPIEKFQNDIKHDSALDSSSKINSLKLFKPNAPQATAASLTDVIPELYLFITQIKETELVAEKERLENFVADSLCNENTSEQIITEINCYKEKMDKHSNESLIAGLENFIQQLATINKQTLSLR